jgi:hypothetical protein
LRGRLFPLLSSRPGFMAAKPEATSDKVIA